ncbi:DUF6233 domain-containing protein [Streptomyces griseoluteus]|uniref:DUF6233 domain-containing protein n=1 Tax=Streptomyces griseoluteus TaxID=29306 RepID=UPI0036FE5811
MRTSCRLICPRLRTLETWLALTLERVRAAITDGERREVERQRGQQARPPAPEWVLQLGPDPRNVEAVHVGDCPTPRKRRRTRAMTRQQAVDALSEQVPACPLRRPDTVLGVLDQGLCRN